MDQLFPSNKNYIFQKSNTNPMKKITQFNFARKAFLVLVLLASFVRISFAQTGDPDLPNPSSNIQTVPAGTLVIAMDNTLQANPGYFNLKSYGLIFTLLNNEKPLNWVIKAGKSKDGIDFTANATRVYPSAQATASRNFKAGPFLILPRDSAGVAAIINTYNNSLSSTAKVNVYRLTQATVVDVRYTLNQKPKAGIISDGQNQKIHLAYFTNANIPSYNYSVTAASNLNDDCYTIATEPHSDKIPDAIIQIVHNYVSNGGNFLAECKAIDSYENSPSGFFQTSSGSNIVNKSGTSISYPFPDLSFSQYEGIFDPIKIGGAEQNWNIKSGSSYINNGHSHQYVVVNGQTLVGQSVSKEGTGAGHLVFYTGGHDYNGTAINDLNGQRSFFNAVLTPSNVASCNDRIFGSDLAVTQLATTPVYVNHMDTFIVTVINNGPSSTTLSSVVLRDMLPSRFAFISYNASQGSYNSTTGIWSIGNLSLGQSETISIIALAKPSSVINEFSTLPNSSDVTNVAYVDKVSGDINQTNDTSRFTVSIIDCPTPSFSINPSNTTVCAGSSASFSVSASGVNLTYQWQVSTNGVNFNNITSPGSSSTYSGYNTNILGLSGTVESNNGYSYRVVVTDDCGGSVTSSSASLIVNSTPVITVNPVSQNVCEGSSVTFTVSATGSGLTYQWRKSGINIFGADRPSYTINPVSTANEGNYDVVVSGICSPSAVSSTVTLSVNTSPIILMQPSNVTICAGNPASFAINATGSNLNYQWQVSSDAINYSNISSAGSNPIYSGFTATVLNLNGTVIGNNNLRFRAVVSNGCLSTTSNSVLLIVNPNPDVSNFSTTASSVCVGSASTVRITSSTLGNGNYTVNYTLTGSNPSANNSVALTMNNGTGSFNTSNLNNTGAATVIINSIQTSDSCITNLSNGNIANFNVILFPDVSNLSIVANSVCLNLSSVITVNSSTLGNGTFTVTYNLNGANSSIGNTATLIMNNGTGTFNTALLSNSGANTITLTAIQLNSNNCSTLISNGNTALFEIYPTPNVNGFNISATSVCAGLSSIVTVNSNTLGDGVFTITYDLIGSNVSSGNTITLIMNGGTGTFNTTNLTSSGSMAVTITSIRNSGGCSSIISSGNTAFFNVYPKPDVSSFNTTANSVCVNTTSTVTVNSTSLGDGTFIITYNLSGANNATGISATLVTNNNTGSFNTSLLTNIGTTTITITSIKNLSNCIINLSSGNVAVFDVNSAPNVNNFNISATSVCIGLVSTVTINSTTLGNGTYQITYNIGGANFASGITTTLSMNNGTGTFVTPNLFNTGLNSLTITFIRSGSGCGTSISAGNTTNFNVNTTIDVSNLSTAASSACVGFASTVTVNSTTIGNGTYTITYDLSGATSSIGNTAQLILLNGTGTFVTPNLFNNGSTTVTLTFIQNGVGCGTNLTSGNTASFNVDNILDVSNFNMAASSACVGAPSTISVSSTTLGNGTFTVTYNLSGANILLANSATLIMNNGRGTFLTSDLLSAGLTTATITYIQSSVGCGNNVNNGNTATFNVNFSLDVTDFNTAGVADLCVTSNLIVPINSTTLGNGTFTVTYNLSGANTAIGNTATLVINNGFGVFTIPALTNAGTTIVTITSILSPSSGCSANITSGNTATFVTNLLPDVTDFNTSAIDVCAGTSSLVTLNSTTIGNGAYIVTYNLTGANTVIGQTSTCVISNTTGSFNTSILNYSGTTTITITSISSVLGCAVNLTAGNTATFTVIPKPDISIYNISASSICAGNGSSITVNSSTLGNGTFTVTYNLSGGNSVIGSTATLTMNGGTGTFTTNNCNNFGLTNIIITSIQNSLGCITNVPSDNTAFIVSPNVNPFNFSTTANSACVGSGATVTVNSTTLGTGIFIINYALSGANVSGTQTATLLMDNNMGTFLTSNLVNPGSTTVTISFIQNAFGCGTPVTVGNSALFNVHSNLDVSNLNISSTSACINSNSTITVNSTTLGNGLFTVTYNLSGANVSSSNTATLFMNNNSGTFATPNLLNSGWTIISITGIQSSSTCSNNVSAVSSAFYVDGGANLNDFHIAATSVCINSGSTVTINSNTLGDGTFTVTYDLAGANSIISNTATFVMNGGIGSFVTSPLSNLGLTTVTITSIFNSTGCISTVTSGNVAGFFVNSNLDASNFNVIASSVCVNSSSTIIVNSSTIGNGVFIVAYSLNGATTFSGVATMTMYNGSGSFNTPVLSNAGSTIITITSLQNTTDCVGVPSSGNLAIFNVNAVPDLSNFNLSAGSACIGLGSTIMVSSSTLVNGDYTVVYNLSGANTGTSITSTLSMNNGTGTFMTSNLNNTGNTTIKIISLQNSFGCSKNLTSGDTASFVVNPNPDISNYNTSASSVCIGTTSVITVNSTTLGDGNYTVTYNLSGSTNSLGLSASLTMSNNKGTFSTLPLTNIGLTNIALTSIQNSSGCIINVPTDNTAFNVYPNLDASNFSTTASSVCIGMGSTVTINSSTIGNGVFTVNYNLNGTNNSTGNSATLLMSNGTGYFVTDSLNNSGATTITITAIYNVFTCNSTVTSGNTANFSVNSASNVTSFNTSASSVCAGSVSVVTINSSTLGSGLYTVTYDISGANIYTAQTASVTVNNNTGSFNTPNLNNAGQTIITITSIETALGCKTSIPNGNTTNFDVYSNPDVTTFITSANPACLGSGANIEIYSTTLTSGVYLVTYNLIGANSSNGNTATMILNSPNGSFSTSPLNNPGLTTVIITSVKNTFGCNIVVSSGNTASFNVNSSMDVSNFSVSATSVCTNSSSNVTVNSSTIGNGTFTVTYNLSGANISNGDTATLVMSNNSGVFSTGVLANAGPTAVTITFIKNSSGCSSIVSAGNTATFNVVSNPDVSNFSVSASSPCVGSGSVVLVSSNTLGNGTFTVTYNLTGSNSLVGNTTTLVMNNGSGTFMTSNLLNSGSTAVTITSIQNSNGCTSVVTNGNTAIFNVGQSLDVSDFHVLAGSACIGGGAAITINSNSLGNGTFKVIYNLSGANVSSTDTAILIMNNNTGVFITSVLPNAGFTTITITSLQLSSGCGNNLSSGNTATFNVIPNLDVSNLTVSATSICVGSSSLVTVNSTTLSSGTFVITYNLSGVNIVNGDTAVLIMNNNTGTFNTSILNNAGNTAITITFIKNSSGCSNVISSGNTATFNVYSNPDVSNFNTSASSPCVGSGSIVTINSTSLGNGNFIINYNLTGANTLSAGTATLSMVNNTGTFITSVLPNFGSTTITITSIQNSNGCTSIVSNGNIAIFNVGQNLNVSNFSVSANPPCIGTGADITVNSTSIGNGVFKVTYSLIGANVVNNDTATLVMNNNTGMFTTSVLNNLGSTAITITFIQNLTGCGNILLTGNTASFNVNSNPDLTNLSLSATSPCVGSVSSVNVNSTSLGNGTFTVSYNLSGANSAIGISTTLIILNNTGTFETSSLTNTGATTITITSVQNSNGCISVPSNGNTTTFNVNQTLDVSNFITTANSPCVGSSAVVTVNSNTIGNGTFTVIYSMIGANTANGDTAVLIMNNNTGTFSTKSLSKSGATALTITFIQNSTGCGSSVSVGNTATFNVGSNPDVSNFNLSASSPCIGGVSTVTVNSTSLGNGIFTLTYNLSGANTSSAGTATLVMNNNFGTFVTPVLSTPGSTAITISSIQNSNGCTSIVNSGNTALFNVSQLMNDSDFHISAAEACIGGNARIIVNSTTLGNGVFTVTYNLIGANVSSNDTASFNINNNTGSFNTNILTNLGATTIVVTSLQNSSGCFIDRNDSLTFNVIEAPTTANAGNDQTDSANCGITTTALTANVPVSGNGLWNIVSGVGGTITDSANPLSAFSGVAGESYVLSWTISTTCSSSSDSVNITFGLSPTIANAGPDQIDSLMCGDTSTILAANIPSAGIGVWSIVSGVNGILADSTNPTSAFSGVAGNSYMLSWTTTVGTCSSTDSVNISFNISPSKSNAGIDQKGSEMCGLTSTILSADTPLIGNGMWTVLTGGGGAFEDSTNSSTIFNGVGGTTYNLEWAISNACGVNRDTVMIEFLENPSTSFAGIDQTFECSTTEVTLSANSPAIGIGMWSVIQGTGFFSDVNNPNAVVSQLSGGANILQWTVTNNACTPSVSNVEIYIDCKDIFTGITPNDDGFNDFWTIPLLESHQSNEVFIYNRWGTEVWRTKDYNNTTNYWKGKNMKDNDVPDGTYYYIVKFDGETKAGWLFMKH